MKVCIVGAGAIGGLLGARLALAGADVSLIARGPHLNALQWNGIEVSMADGTQHLIPEIRATDRFEECGRQDLVVIALKAQQIAPVVGRLRTLLGPDTMVMGTQNGIPWWYFQRYRGAYAGYRIDAVDPAGAISAAIESERVIGSVIYANAEVTRPGVIRHIEGMVIPIGELDGAQTPRIRAVRELLVKAGFKARVQADIRSRIWLKALGILGFDPISALTHATLSEICNFPLARDLVARTMTEAEAVAAKLGITLRVPIEDRIAGAERIGNYKTSLLKDVEAGKELETNALIGAILELGELTGTPTPHISSAYALVKLLESTMARRNAAVRPVAPDPIPPDRRAGRFRITAAG